MLILNVARGLAFQHEAVGVEEFRHILNLENADLTVAFHISADILLRSARERRESMLRQSLCLACRNQQVDEFPIVRIMKFAGHRCSSGRHEQVRDVAA